MMPLSKSAYYEVAPNTFYPRVTSIVGLMAKPALVNWAARVEREATVKLAVETHKSNCIGFEESLRGIAVGRFESDNVKDASAATGKAVHKKIEWALKQKFGQPVGPEPDIPPAAELAYNLAIKFLAEGNFQPLYSEQLVWNHDHKYAGTLDCLALSEDGLIIFDWKTGTGIYPEFLLQLGAYAAAVDSMGHGPVKKASIVRLPTTEGGKPEVKSYSSEELRAGFEDAFLPLRKLWEWVKS